MVRFLWRLSGIVLALSLAATPLRAEPPSGSEPAFDTLAPDAPAPDAPLPAPSNDVPVTQTEMREGVVRYSVWIKVGDRFVEALLDTGSTGLRVLPAVVPGDLVGLPLEYGYGSGMNLKGLAVRTRVEIGSLSAQIPIEVVDHLGCTDRRPDCIVKQRGNDSLIAGDGASGHGYSAILGIGFSSRGFDIPNPLEALGATRWMVHLPRPGDIEPGHVVLDPDAAARRRFTMLAGTKFGDLSGCLQNAKHDQDVCGAILLDTGAPAVAAWSEDQENEAVWAAGTPATLRFAPEFKLAFDTGDVGSLSQVSLYPAKQRLNPEVPFILGGILPYLTFDVLYDASDHKVGLARR